jgi:ubiquinone biosynthesis protein
MIQPSSFQALVSGIAPAHLNTIAQAFFQGASAGRIAAVEAVLKSPDGRSWRSDVGKWITTMVPVDVLVPEASRKWRPLVQDAVQFVFSHLSNRRLAAKLVEQVELPAATPPESRLIRLISKMPGLQKLGQVLARNRRLSPALRDALAELENGMSDMQPEEIRAIIAGQLGPRLETHAVEIAPSIYKEGSASAVIRFTWDDGDGDRQRGVFKVLKPYVPECFAEDMTLLQRLGDFLASSRRGYDFAVRDVQEMMSEVRLLLENELDFRREQAALVDAQRGYRSSFGIRVPSLIPALCTAQITAMTEEAGMKVTEAFRGSPIRRNRIAAQLIEALLAVPLFSREDPSVFHADPHAGNLMYDEPNRELVILDWALAQRLSLELRRQVVMLVLMMMLRNRAGVCNAIRVLSLANKGRTRARNQLIDRCVNQFFDLFPADRSPGTLDAMVLLDQIALEGVRFPSPLFMFRKIVFTLDGVLHDVAGADVRIDSVIAREFMTRWASSFGILHAPLTLRDFRTIQWQALLYPARSLGRRLVTAPQT